MEKEFETNEMDLHKKIILIAYYLVNNRPSEYIFNDNYGNTVTLRYYTEDLQYSSAQHDDRYWNCYELRKNTDDTEAPFFECRCPDIEPEALFINGKKVYPNPNNIASLSSVFDCASAKYTCEILEHYFSLTGCNYCEYEEQMRKYNEEKEQRNKLKQEENRKEWEENRNRALQIEKLAGELIQYFSDILPPPKEAGASRSRRLTPSA